MHVHANNTTITPQLYTLSMHMYTFKLITCMQPWSARMVWMWHCMQVRKEYYRNSIRHVFWITCMIIIGSSSIIHLQVIMILEMMMTLWTIYSMSSLTTFLSCSLQCMPASVYRSIFKGCLSFNAGKFIICMISWTHAEFYIKFYIPLLCGC